MHRMLTAALIAAIVLFLWNFISWVVLPFHTATLNTLPAGEEISSALAANVSEHGVYHFPGAPKSASQMEAVMERAQRGPNVPLLLFLPGGVNQMDPLKFLRSFLLNLLTAFVACWLLTTASEQSRIPWSFGRKVSFVTLLGLLAAVMYPLAEWNWFQFPLDYTLVVAADGVVGALLMGLVLAWRSP